MTPLRALISAVLVGPFIGTMIGCFLGLFFAENYYYGFMDKPFDSISDHLEGTLKMGLFGSIYAYPTTILIGVPIGFLYQRFNIKKVWPLALIGGLIGGLIWWPYLGTFYPLAGLCGASVAYITAKLYLHFKIKAPSPLPSP